MRCLTQNRKRAAECPLGSGAFMYVRTHVWIASSLARRSTLVGHVGAEPERPDQGTEADRCGSPPARVSGLRPCCETKAAGRQIFKREAFVETVLHDSLKGGNQSRHVWTSLPAAGLPTSLGAGLTAFIKATTKVVPDWRPAKCCPGTAPSSLSPTTPNRSSGQRGARRMQCGRSRTLQELRSKHRTRRTAPPGGE